jgi:hypothetical protein
VYARVEQREPWLRGAKPIVQIGVLQAQERPVGQGGRIKVAGPEEGAVRILTQTRHQFDLIDRAGELERYELIVLPDTVLVDEELAARLKKFVKSGGALLASGNSGLNSDQTSAVLEDLGVQVHGRSPYQTTYIRFGPGISTDVLKTDHVMYENGVRVTPIKGAESLAKVVEPYFDRSWKHFSSHFQTPPDRVSRYSAAVQNGRVAYIAYPIFGAFAGHGSVPYRLLVRNVIERLMPEPLLRIEGPTSLETSVMRQDKRTIVHLLYYTAERRTEKLDLIEDVVPIFDLPMSLKLAKAPRRVYVAPEGIDVPFEYLNGRVNLRVPEINGHAMIVFE